MLRLGMSQNAFGPTVVLLSTATTPPTVVAVFTLNPDFSITGVGSSNVTGTWGYSGSGTSNMQVSLDIATYDANGVLQTLQNTTIGFYMISSTLVGNFDFPAIVQTTFNAVTGHTTKQSLNPYSPDGSGSAFQLAAFPLAFNNGPLALSAKVRVTDEAPKKA